MIPQPGDYIECHFRNKWKGICIFVEPRQNSTPLIYCVPVLSANNVPIFKSRLIQFDSAWLEVIPPFPFPVVPRGKPYSFDRSPFGRYYDSVVKPHDLLTHDHVFLFRAYLNHLKRFP